MKVSLKSGSGVNPNRIPRKQYKLRIIEEPELKESSKKNLYLLFKFEIIEPQVVTVDGNDIVVEGQELQCNCMLPPSNPFMLEALHNALGYPVDDIEFDDSTGLPAGLTYTGREVWALCYSEEQPQMDENKQPMTNPATGEPLVMFRKTVKQFYY